jgi:hypothetical protein
MSKLVYLNEIVIVPPSRSRVLQAVARGMSVIGRLHLVPDRVRCPVSVKRRARTQGTYDATPPHIELHPQADHPLLTLAHEIGHFLDNRCLHAVYRGWASEIDPDFGELHGCWENSQLLRDLLELQTRCRPRLKGLRGDLAYLDSLTALRELWACTYAQWIATKSGDPVLTSELVRHIQPTGSIADMPYTTQWEPDDFKPIMQAVDNLFGNRGWL